MFVFFIFHARPHSWQTFSASSCSCIWVVGGSRTRSSVAQTQRPWVARWSRWTVSLFKYTLNNIGLKLQHLQTALGWGVMWTLHFITSLWLYFHNAQAILCVLFLFFLFLFILLCFVNIFDKVWCGWTCFGKRPIWVLCFGGWSRKCL